MGKTLCYGEFKFGKSPAKPTTKGYAKGGKTGLWDNIHAKRERIEDGSGERMRKPGSKGAPTNQDFKAAASKMKEGGSADMAQDKAMIKKAIKQHDAQKHSGSEGTKLALKKGGQAKMTGMKREPEAIVKKEVALLKKAGAPAKLIKHEEREGALIGLQKGGKPKKYQEGGSAQSSMPAENIFSENNGRYMHNNEEISKQEFDRRRAAVKSEMRSIRGPDRSKMPLKDRAKSAFDELSADADKKPYKKGGNVKKHADSGVTKSPMTDNMQRYGMKKGGVPTHNRNPKIC